MGWQRKACKLRDDNELRDESAEGEIEPRTQKDTQTLLIQKNKVPFLNFPEKQPNFVLKCRKYPANGGIVYFCFVFKVDTSELETC